MKDDDEHMEDDDEDLEDENSVTRVWRRPPRGGGACRRRSWTSTGGQVTSNSCTHTLHLHTSVKWYHLKHYNALRYQYK